MLEFVNSDMLVRFSEHFLVYTFQIDLENQEYGNAQSSNFFFWKVLATKQLKTQYELLTFITALPCL